MAHDTQLSDEVAMVLTAFKDNPANADVIDMAKNTDWANASPEQRVAVLNAFFAAPEIASIVRTTTYNGYNSNGIGGLVSASLVMGGGGGGTLSESGETRSVGFAFGLASESIGINADFLFISYKGRPSEFYGVFHGAFASMDMVPGIGVYTAHLGPASDPKWECFIWAVGIGTDGDAVGFRGAAWQS
jgi:hypothetical protein